MAYTTETLVTNWIGANYDSTTDLTSAQVVAFIADADGVIDDACAKKFYQFNAVNSTKTDGTTTYTTPKMVALCSRHLAVSMCLRQLRVQADNTELKDSADYHWDQGVALLNQLTDPQFVMDAAVYLNETLTFGTGAQSWTLQTGEAFLANTSPLDTGDPPNIIESSVRVGSGATSGVAGISDAQLQQMRNGVEFDVVFDPNRQKYVFRAHHTALYEAGTVCKITWEWDYRRERGLEPPLSGFFSSG